MARKKAPPPDCLTCGACCVAPHEQDVYADVSPADEKRMGRRLVRLHVLHPSPMDNLLSALGGPSYRAAVKTKQMKPRTGPMKKFELCACSALRGAVMQKVSCSIYSVRPEVCRKAVKPGDRECRAIRKAFFEHIEG